MHLTANSKTRKEVCAYEKVCAYKKGTLNNPSLRSPWKILHVHKCTGHAQGFTKFNNIQGWWPWDPSSLTRDEQDHVTTIDAFLPVIITSHHARPLAKIIEFVEGLGHGLGQLG